MLIEVSLLMSLIAPKSYTGCRQCQNLFSKWARDITMQKSLATSKPQDDRPGKISIHLQDGRCALGAHAHGAGLPMPAQSAICHDPCSWGLTP